MFQKLHLILKKIRLRNSVLFLSQITITTGFANLPFLILRHFLCNLYKILC